MARSTLIRGSVSSSCGSGASRLPARAVSVVFADLGPILALPDGRMAVQWAVRVEGADRHSRFRTASFPAARRTRRRSAGTGRSDAIAFVAGTGERRRIALASLADGHLDPG